MFVPRSTMSRDTVERGTNAIGIAFVPRSTVSRDIVERGTNTMGQLLEPIIHTILLPERRQLLTFHQPF